MWPVRGFLRHLFRYWEIIRSRIPPESETIIDAMRTSGQLYVLAGRIRDLAESEAAMGGALRPPWAH